jgi:hypothetical protein
MMKILIVQSFHVNIVLLKAEFPSEPDFVLSFGFNSQTVEIQTAIDEQSDSKQHVIGFKTADQKITMLFRLRLFHYTLQ